MFLDSTGTVAGNDWTYIADLVLYSKTYDHLITSLKDKVSNVYYTLFLAIFQNNVLCNNMLEFTKEETMCKVLGCYSSIAEDSSLYCVIG
jgi:hypothetical protein